MPLSTFTKTFDVRDIDPVALKSRAKAEANRVWNEYQNRTWKEAYEVCLKGHTAELHVISQGFEDLNKEYMDQLDFDGVTADQKVWDITNIDNPGPWLQEAEYNNTRDWRCRKAKYDDGMSDRVYVWLLNGFMCSLYAIFEWNKTEKKFKKVQKYVYNASEV